MDLLRYEPCDLCGEPMIVAPEVRRHPPLDCALTLRTRVHALRNELERREAHDRALRAATESVRVSPSDSRIEHDDAIAVTIDRARADSQRALRAAADASAAAARSMEASTQAVAQIALQGRRRSSTTLAAVRDLEDEPTRRERPPMKPPEKQ